MNYPSENKENQLINSLYSKTENNKIKWSTAIDLRSLNNDATGFETKIDNVKIKIWKTYDTYFIEVTNPEGNSIKIKEEERPFAFSAFTSSFSSTKLNKLFELVRDKVTNYNSNLDNLLNNIDNL